MPTLKIYKCKCVLTSVAKLVIIFEIFYLYLWVILRQNFGDNNPNVHAYVRGTLMW
jgi:hypothetical protein